MTVSSASPASAPLSSFSVNRRWILIAAYDVSTGQSSEGYIAYNVISRLSKTYRIVLITRINNKSRLSVDPKFLQMCPGVRLVGFDLPKWAAWWKRGSRFYQLYAYLWQMFWPQFLRPYARLRRKLSLVHVLNFHNDNFPSTAWQLGPPVVWGPINHNEIVDSWRRAFWPLQAKVRHVLAFFVRRVLWKLDPFLWLQVRTSRVVLSAGSWVDRRLGLVRKKGVIRRSQLGTNRDIFHIMADPARPAKVVTKLICAGRLDWIKGVDLAIEVIALLPAEYLLTIVGEGPAEARLRALARQRRVESRVIFHPPVVRSCLAHLYAQSDLFLFTSAEVAGLVWVEALATGLPVVAFEGESEVTDAGRILPGVTLAPRGSTRVEQIRRFAAAIQLAAKTPRNPIALRDAVLDQYGWDRLTSTLQEAYSLVSGETK